MPGPIQRGRSWVERILSDGVETVNTIESRTAGVPVYDVTHEDYGAVGDGTSDDRAAIQEAIDDSEAADRGIVYLPPGEYLLASTTESFKCLTVRSDGITVRGAGRGATTLTLADGVDAHAIDLEAVADCDVQHLSIDGNRTNQTDDVHGIRGQNLDSCRFANLNINNCARYGIGLQSGPLSDNTIENVQIDSTDADGIDVKNTQDSIKDNTIKNVTVSNHGLDGTLGSQAGVDLRGVGWQVDNVTVKSYGSGSGLMGVRLRQDDADGAGARYSELSNITCDPGTQTGTYGVVVAERGCTIENIHVFGAARGIELRQRETSLSNIHIIGGGDGLVCSPSSLTTDPEKTRITNLLVRDVDDTAIDIQTNVNLIRGFTVANATTGISVSGNSNEFAAGSVESTTTPLDDTGTGNNISHGQGQL